MGYRWRAGVKMKIVLIVGGIVLGCVTILFVLIDVAIVRAGECMRGMEEPGWEDTREQR